MRVIKDPRKVLAHWIYTREEWKRFRQWERNRLGWVRYLLSRFNQSHSSSLPEITITSERVFFNGKGEIFIDDSCKLRRVHVRESGNLNVLEIFYQPGTRSIRVIRVPVPRGQLRQAIEVQECLDGNRSAMSENR